MKLKSKNLISISDFKNSITEFEPNSHNLKSKIPNFFVYLELFLIYCLDMVFLKLFLFVYYCSIVDEKIIFQKILNPNSASVVFY